VSSPRTQPAPGEEEEPSGLVRGDRATPGLSLAVGRALGTVVVTVDGALNVDSSQFLARVLSDLIEGQGNLAVAVDLGKAVVDPEAVTVFAEAAQRASRRGAKFILERPPIEAHAALQAGGYTDLVEIRPRPDPDA
jgi:anti-anti-sigma regulatory factor